MTESNLELFFERMKKHIQDLCPFAISDKDVQAVDEWCTKNKCNPNLSTLKEVFKDKFDKYQLTKRRRTTWRKLT